ncbi:MAG TPA: histidinol dehydrogenase [Acidimicrobiales bacterium]|nr:histidinol dehydrogenase [Acidimicrobiales bacterium]
MAQTLKAAQPRSTASSVEVEETVAAIIAAVRANGDSAVREWSEKLDSWAPPSFLLSEKELGEIVRGLPATVVEDLEYVQKQVWNFARCQLGSLHDFEVEVSPGVRLGQRNIPVAAAGAYIPGGRYALTASAHMTIVTAKAANVGRVAACTPPIRGELPLVTLAAMQIGGADEVYVLGGVQAVAALALGTETIAPVDLMTGPGNAFVAEAKRQLYGEVGIDLVAGPTEILVIADESADAFVVAVDLLSQAEHGPDSPAVLVTTSETLARQVIAYVDQLLPTMPTRDLAAPAWRDHGQVIVAGSLEEAYVVADELAFEHVEVLTEEPRKALESLSNYGALFLGEGTCVSYGDKVIGTNHVLPTRRGARYTGGLWVGKFLKTVTYQEVTDLTASGRLGELCGRVARVEGFEGHARSGDVRAHKSFGSPLEWSPVVSSDEVTTDGATLDRDR